MDYGADDLQVLRHWRLWGETSAGTNTRPAIGCRCENFFGERFVVVAQDDVGATLERQTWQGAQRHTAPWRDVLNFYLFPS